MKRTRISIGCTAIAFLTALGAAEAQVGLQFNGSTQYVSMGAAPGLRASPAFTIECWFKRTATGVGVSTGTGGIASLVPLVAKGAAESETAGLNANYILGIDTSTNTIGVDFEEAAGPNHPLTVPTSPASNVIALNTWYHVAATYDGTTWRIYQNGSLVHSAAVGSTPEPNSAQAFGIGTTLTSATTPVAAGFFAGVIDEVRVWNLARSAVDVSANMNLPIATATGLIGRWGLNEGATTEVFDSSTAGSAQEMGTLTPVATPPTWVTGAPALQTAGERIVTFQQNVNGYTSALDTTLDALNTGTAQNGAVSLTIDGGGDGATNERHTLMRFDNIFGSGTGQVPSGVTLQSATMTVNVSNATANAPSVYRMVANFSAAATWASFVGGVQANGTEARTTADYAPANLTTIAVHNVELTNSVQAWYGGSPNEGWAWLPSGTDGLVFDSADSGTAANRPRLVVSYYAPANAPPNQPTVVIPANGATGVGTSPTLTVNATDPESNPMTVTFFGRENTIPAPGPDFSIIALPDTQFYACGAPCSSDNGLLNAQLQWIVDNKVSRNIAFVTQLGDCVEHGNDGNANGANAEWDAANAAWSLIENPVTTLLTYGIPYGIAVGNHDQTPINSPRSGADEGATTTRYNNTFGVSRFLGRSYYGGRYDFGAPATYPNNNDNHYELFSASGLDFIIIHLEFESSASATRTAVLAWANGLLQTNSTRRAIITAHYFLNPDGTFGDQGQATYDALKGNPNLFLMLCGHLDQANRRADIFGGNTVHTLLSDYQSRPTGGRGWMRRLLFSPANNTIHVETFSPWANYPTLPKQEQLINSHADNTAGTAQNDFTLSYSMTSSPPAFVQIGSPQTVTPPATAASVVWAGLNQNTTYEWKVTVADSGSTTNGPTWNFQTQCTGDAACDDGNPCTTDACTSGACTHTNNTNSCNDGNNCTTGDVCGGGVCAGTPTNCLPGTTCNPANGLCEAQPVTVTFQQGVSSYAGAVDTYLNIGEPTTSKATVTPLIIDPVGTVGSPLGINQALLRFDNIFGTGTGQIPPGATIQSATLTVSVTNGNASNAPATMHQMLQSWVDTDTWNSRVNGIQTDNSEAATTPDVSSVVLATGVQSITVTNSLTAWNAAPASNRGWAFIPHASVDDSLQFESSESTTAANRPKLTVTYLPPPPCNVNGDCNDGNACTTDTCSSGTCVYSPITCNDSNACTTDTCNPASGCVYTSITCNDNDGCTTDTCNPASGCVYTPVDCADSDPCTADSCQPANTAAVALSGSSQYVSLGSGPAVNNFGTGSFTIEGWVRLGAGAGGTNVGLFRMGRSGAWPQATVQILANTAQIQASVENNTGNQVDAPGTTLSTGIWTHFAAVADRTAGAQRLRLYVNGALASSNVDASTWGSAAISSPTDASLLGATREVGGTLNAFLNGALDEVRVWNTARTQAEIQANMSVQLLSGTGLIARWGLNEGSSTSAADSVGSNTGTLTGGATWVTGAANLVNMGSGGCVHTPIANCCTSAAQCNDNDPCTNDTCDSGTCGHTPVSCPSGQTCNSSNGQCELLPVTVSFQNGVNGYGATAGSGTVDTYLNQGNAGTSNATTTPLVVDLVGNPSGVNQTLLRFENIFGTGTGQIPPGATIQSATLTLDVTNDNPNAPAAMHRMLQAWVDSDTWTSRVNGVQTDGTEAVASADVTSLVLALPLGLHTITVTNSVQAWNASPSSNRGWVFIPSATTDDGLAFSSSEATTVANRPKLTVTYLPTPQCQGPGDCDDGNPCTTDTCSSGTCVHTNNTASCNDGNACTTGDTCSGGSCAGTPMACDDSDACTIDSCNAGNCVHTQQSCDDGDSCTVDSCSGGTCQHVVNCDDGNPCTVDSCAPGNTSAVQFDGTNDFITMGQATALGASSFTVECWFKRTSAGSAGLGTSTGSNGFAGTTAVPLVTKGRGEADSSNLDCNYFVGLHSTSNVLIADFEEGATGTSPGLNHPVCAATAITDTNWHHAAATYSVATGWAIYLDGVAQTLSTTCSSCTAGTNCTLPPGMPPRSDSVQHFAIGSALNSAGAADGYFAGSIDEVRVWNVVRTGTEISTNMNAQITSGTGLIGRWGLNDGAGSTATGTFGPNGTLTNGPGWVTSGLPNLGGGCTHVVQDSDGDGTCDANDGCPNDPNKTAPGQCGCGNPDTDTDGDGTANCNDGCPNDPNKTAPGICGCGVADTDSDGDGTANCNDGCPNDPNKIAPGICGCGVADTDSDGDGTANCNDGCPNDPNKIAPGICGCGVADTDSDGDGTANCNDGCPSDPLKTTPGVCGCGVADTDTDNDGTPNCNDLCPTDPLKTNPGTCGCGVSDVDSDGDLIPDCIDTCPGQPDVDSDGDGVLNCNDGCPNDVNKIAPGQCGCGIADTDTDNDGTANCNDGCPNDPLKIAPGQCGCGTPETDTDNDGTPNCLDACPNDPAKTVPGQCGCGVPETDTDSDGTADCNDGCPLDPNKIAPGACGCGFSDADADGDGTPNCHDGCPSDPLKTAPGQCGCGNPDTDTDNDGTANCNDGCPLDPNKIAPGACGCGVADTDSDDDKVPDCHDNCPGAPDVDTDGDGALDCVDGCPNDPLKTSPGQCGCGNPETDSDGDGTANCNDGCPNDATKITPGVCGCGTPDADGDGDGAPNCIDGCPADPGKTNPGVCGCGTPDTDSDGDLIPDCVDHCPGSPDTDTDNDGVLDCNDGCPMDPNKTVPGQCGCGTPDTDTDGDGTANCHDACPNDPNKIAAGQCGCGTPDTDTDGDGTANCNDGCPNDPAKTVAGQCGCGNPDTDSDGDGTANCNDGCPADPAKIMPGACGCGVADTDGDNDGTPDCHDLCPTDPAKTAPGQCGCGNPDTDTDGDGTADCNDGCPADPDKTSPGVCGCGVAETDSDNDGTPNCTDGCPTDPNKIAPGVCGCGVSDADSDGDGTANCNDGCPTDEHKINPGVCGCGISDTDTDGDLIPDCIDDCPGAPDVDSDGDKVLDCDDGCPSDPNKVTPGQCGCGVADTDTDGDGTANCNDGCPGDPDKVTPGQCGCGVADTDTDGDGTADCNDGCPSDSNKVAAGACGCGVADTDSDSDGVPDCHDLCSGTPGGETPNAQGCACSQLNCNDGNACTADGCTNGVCSNTPISCDDGNACTTDSCDMQTGCQHLPISCSDGDPCTQDVCDAQLGCQHPPVTDGTSCSNGVYCDGAETCVSGACQTNAPPCDSAHCVEASDICLQCVNNAECSDGNACNGEEACVAGTCQPGTPLVCNDNNPCTTDSCNPVTGCVYTPLNCINVTLHADGLGHAVTRSVTFVLTPCGGSPETRVLPIAFTPSGMGYGVGSVVLTNVNPNTAWLSAREGHTIRRRLPVSFPPTLQASVSFTGTSKLLAGDLQTAGSGQDNLVDVIDFAILASRWNTVVNDCATGLPAECARGADVNGDGQQGTIDFTALQINFFAVGDANDACPSGLQAKRPIGVDRPLNAAYLSRVSVSQIAGRVPNAALADQNGDGTIDANDIRLFAARNRLTLLPSFDQVLTRTAAASSER